MKLYTYVIRSDNGSAPNYDPPFTTLAICKPDIRRCAQVGDAVLAFTGRNLSREAHAVCWAGVIREKVTFAEYWRDRRFQGKKPGRSATPDNIYEPIGSRLWQVKNPVHDDGNALTDLSGAFVLVLDPVWRFGASGPVLPGEFGLRMVGGRRKHRVHDLTKRAWHRLSAWLDRQEQARDAARGGSCGNARPAPAPRGCCS
ncbi:MAG TPA: hypothetical protein VIL32_00040 [Steroidobacteraceae bacterium]